jgi:hypothetical protein
VYECRAQRFSDWQQQYGTPVLAGGINITSGANVNYPFQMVEYPAFQIFVASLQPDSNMMPTHSLWQLHQAFKKK